MLLCHSELALTGQEQTGPLLALVGGAQLAEENVGTCRKLKKSMEIGDKTAAELFPPDSKGISPYHPKQLIAIFVDPQHFFSVGAALARLSTGCWQSCYQDFHRRCIGLIKP